MTPTSSASIAAMVAYCTAPGTASATSAPAMIGAMVESAPTEMKRLAPKAANAKVPAAKANRPDMGGMPASRAVANCSGIAMAASVIAAIRSPESHAGL